MYRVSKELEVAVKQNPNFSHWLKYAIESCSRMPADHLEARLDDIQYLREYVEARLDEEIGMSNEPCDGRR